jgi:hypothetical protein
VTLKAQTDLNTMIVGDLSDHNRKKLELNNKKKTAENTQTPGNNMLLNDEWVIEEIREEIRKFLEYTKNANPTYTYQQW